VETERLSGVLWRLATAPNHSGTARPLLSPAGAPW